MDTKLFIMISALALIFTLESFIPHYKGRTARIKHAFPHFTVAIINGLLTKFLLTGLTLAALAWAESNALGFSHALPLTPAAKWILAFVLFDIWMYWWHLANHHFEFLWRFHRAHHSDTEMDTTTALRFHPGELILSTFFRLPVLILIGMSFSQLLVFETTLSVSALFHHSNLAIPEKWDRMLRAIIVTPNMHRVHHSAIGAETNSNYTSLLSVWDRLFRSFRIREDTHTITIGLQSFREAKYQRLWGFMITPLL